jgi:hypothetical protein
VVRVDPVVRLGPRWPRLQSLKLRSIFTTDVSGRASADTPRSFQQSEEPRDHYATLGAAKATESNLCQGPQASAVIGGGKSGGAGKHAPGGRGRVARRRLYEKTSCRDAPYYPARLVRGAYLLTGLSTHGKVRGTSKFPDFIGAELP